MARVACLRSVMSLIEARITFLPPSFSVCVAVSTSITRPSFRMWRQVPEVCNPRREDTDFFHGWTSSGGRMSVARIRKNSRRE